MIASLVAMIIGALVGTLLGLLGGGGAVLIVPSMVYLLHVDEHVALATALIIVGLNALVGGTLAYRQGRTQLRTALTFGVSGMLTAYVGARISKLIPGELLLIAFSLLLLVIATFMFRRTPTSDDSPTNHRPVWHMIVVGAGVGFITGTLGVGGGFLIVPAMVLLVRMPMREAVGTSLIVIAINSAASLLGHLDTPFDWWLIAALLAGAIPCVALSGRLGAHIPADKLRKAFAVFISVVAIAMLAENLYSRVS